jgi:hypothetical protein
MPDALSPAIVRIAKQMMNADQNWQYGETSKNNMLWNDFIMPFTVSHFKLINLKLERCTKNIEQEIQNSRHQKEGCRSSVYQTHRHDDLLSRE